MKRFEGMIMRLLLFTILSFFLFPVFAQQKFEPEWLNKPLSFKKKVNDLFLISETGKVHPTPSSDIIYFENGLRSAHFKNLKHWEKIKDSVEVREINLIFSKYPIVGGKYEMFTPLLCARIKNLFEVDPYLNDSAINWTITLQTECNTDEEAKNLFHGVSIKYKSISDIIEAKNAIDIEGKMQVDVEQYHDRLDFMLKSTDLESKIIEDLETKDWVDRSNYLIEVFENNLLSEDSLDVTFEPSKQMIDDTEIYLDEFIQFYGNKKDSSTARIFSRNRQWEDVLVVADWTGSMYQYGAQTLKWHLKNFNTSNIKYFTLFNDGDLKNSEDKKIGSTGGIYHQYANHLEKLVKLYHYVMLKGGGGEPEENDIEAIIEARKKFPNHKDIVLIADNHSCIRDMSLIDSIQAPVHVIVCGYDPRVGINAQYMILALETGGSLHTPEEDIADFRMERKRYGVDLQKTFKSRITSMTCRKGYKIKMVKYYVEKTYFEIDSAIMDTETKKTLDLSNKGISKLPKKLDEIELLVSLNLHGNVITKIPSKISGMKNLSVLNLSDNKIKKIHTDIYELSTLEKLNLENNKLQEVPEELFKMRYLKFLNLNHNQLSTLPKYLTIRQLEEFYMSNNQLTSLPYGIGYLRKTKIFDVSHNNISEVPVTLGSMKELEVLDLSYNSLSELPKNIGKLKQLRTLKLIGNPLSDNEKEKIKKLLPNTQIEF